MAAKSAERQEASGNVNVGAKSENTKQLRTTLAGFSNFVYKHRAAFLGFDLASSEVISGGNLGIYALTLLRDDHSINFQDSAIQGFLNMLRSPATADFYHGISTAQLFWLPVVLPAFAFIDYRIIKWAGPKLYSKVGELSRASYEAVSGLLRKS